MADTAFQLVGSLYINYQNSGWAEKYYLPSLNYADAKTAFAGLCALRANVLADKCAIVWARVSFADKAKDGVAVLNQPLLPSKVVMSADPLVDSQLNDPFTSLHFRFETAGGKWANRLFRGLPDDLVQSFAMTAPVVIPPPAAPPLVIGAGTTYLLVLGAMLAYIRDYTVYVKKPTPPAVNWHSEPWANVMYRRVTSRKTGRPFGMFRGRAASYN